LSHSLFYEESIFTFNNIKLNNITTNSEALLHFINSNIEINHLEANNILCIGDGDATSFLLYNSYESDSQLFINDLNISNSKSNGPFIKILGESNNVIIENSNIENVESFGSIIKNASNKVKKKKKKKKKN